MTNIQIGKFKADEAKAQSWIQRHPGWTLAIGVVEFLVIVWLSLRHL